MSLLILSLATGCFLVGTVPNADAQATEPDRALPSGVDPSLRRKNLGLMLGTPFLHQDELPYASDYHGAYGSERVTYEYDADGLPVFIRHSDLNDRVRYLDAEVSYRDDNQIDELVYYSYDEAGEDVLYEDRFEFSQYTDAGPQQALMTSRDGLIAEMRLSYDENGRLVQLEEDDPMGEGLFRRERYAWVEGLPGSLPYAAEIRYALDDEIERFHYLYDARGRLQTLRGANVVQSDPQDRTPVTELFYYRSGTLDDIFGRIERKSSEGRTARSINNHNS
jgi:hypothetical protein